MSVVAINENSGFTEIGGYAVKMVNKTGSATLAGELIEASSTTDFAFQQCGASGNGCIGAVYEGGVADGNKCWVVVSGPADVLLKNSTAATRGYWAKTSDTAGRADCTVASPPGGSVANLDIHMTQIGSCSETKTGGTNVKARVVLNFN